MIMMKSIIAMMIIISITEKDNNDDIHNNHTNDNNDKAILTRSRIAIEQAGPGVTFARDLRVSAHNRILFASARGHGQLFADFHLNPCGTFCVILLVIQEIKPANNPATLARAALTAEVSRGRGRAPESGGGGRLMVFR